MGFLRAAVLVLPFHAALAAHAGGTLLEAALHDGRLVLNVTGLGGHSGLCVEVEAWNRSAEPIEVTIPAGWRFPSADSTVQDLLTVGEVAFALAPGARATRPCRAFCCEAMRAGPGPGAPFGRGAPAEERLVRLARRLAHGNYPDLAVQQAIWAVSDGAPISGIDAGDGAVTQELRGFVAALTGRPIPWYTTRFAEAAHGRVFNPEPAHVSGRVDFEQRHAGLLSIVVKDAAGRTVHVVSEGRHLRQGRYAIDVELTVRGWSRGRYRICFAADGVLLKEQAFEL